MATAQSETAGNPTAPPSAFRTAFDAFLGAGTSIVTDALRLKGERYSAVQDAKKQVDVQRTFDDLARSSPNYGPNAVAPAARQAVEQTKLITGINLSDPGMKQLLIWGIAAVIGALIIFKIARRK